MQLIIRINICLLFAMMALAVCAGVPYNGGRGANNGGSFPEVACPQLPALVWKASLNNGTDAPSNTIITNGLVIVAFGRKLYAVTVDTGEVRWTQTLPLAPLDDILLLDGRLVISMSNGIVQGRDPSTGEVAWQTTLNTSIVNGPTYDEQYLFYALKSSSIQLIEQHNGKMLNPFTLGHEIAGAPLAQGGSILLTYLDSSQARVEMVDGHVTQRWSAQLPAAPLPLTATADGNQIYVPVAGGIIATDSTDTMNPVLWRYTGDTLPFPLTVDGGLIYAGTRSGTLLALDTTAGKDSWKRTSKDGKTLPGAVLPAMATAAPLVWGTLLVVRMEHGMIGIFTKDTGRMLWLYRMPGVHPALKIGVPGVSGNDLFIATSGGNLLKLSAGAPDVDSPTMSSTQPLNWNDGVNDRKSLRYLGASIEDEGSSVMPGGVTCTLDGTDYTRALQYSAKTSFYFIELNLTTPLAAGIHRLEMTAKDGRGNVSAFTRSFLVADKATPPTLMTIAINGDYAPTEVTVVAGSVVVWQNVAGTPRTVIADDGYFNSDNIFPQGIPDGEVFAWVVPTTLETGKRLPYHCRIKGVALSGALVVGK